jgi:hypothetical protein
MVIITNTTSIGRDISGVQSQPHVNFNAPPSQLNQPTQNTVQSNPSVPVDPTNKSQVVLTDVTNQDAEGVSASDKKLKKPKPRPIVTSTEEATSPSIPPAVTSKKPHAKLVEESNEDLVAEDGDLGRPKWIREYKRTLEKLLRTAAVENETNRELVEKSILFEKVFGFKVRTF